MMNITNAAGTSPIKTTPIEVSFSYQSRQAIVANQELNLPDFPEVSLNLNDTFL